MRVDQPKILYVPMAIAAIFLFYGLFIYESPVQLIETGDCDLAFKQSESGANTFVSHASVVFSDRRDVDTRGGNPLGLISKLTYVDNRLILSLSGIKMGRFCFEPDISTSFTLQDGSIISLWSSHKHNCTQNDDGDPLANAPISLFELTPGTKEFTKLLTSPALSVSALMGEERVKLPIFSPENSQRLQEMLTCGYKKFFSHIPLAK
jgi:hypothetical protein